MLPEPGLGDIVVTAPVEHVLHPGEGVVHEVEEVIVLGGLDTVPEHLLEPDHVEVRSVGVTDELLGHQLAVDSPKSATRQLVQPVERRLGVGRLRAAELLLEVAGERHRPVEMQDERLFSPYERAGKGVEQALDECGPGRPYVTTNTKLRGGGSASACRLVSINGGRCMSILRPRLDQRVSIRPHRVLTSSDVSR